MDLSVVFCKTRSPRIPNSQIPKFPNSQIQDWALDPPLEGPILDLGIWEFGNLGIWEFGNLGIWEFRNWPPPHRPGAEGRPRVSDDPKSQIPKFPNSQIPGYGNLGIWEFGNWPFPSHPITPRAQSWIWEFGEFGNLGICPFARIWELGNLGIGPPPPHRPSAEGKPRVSDDPKSQIPKFPNSQIPKSRIGPSTPPGPYVMITGSFSKRVTVTFAAPPRGRLQRAPTYSPMMLARVHSGTPLTDSRGQHEPVTDSSHLFPGSVWARAGLDVTRAPGTPLPIPGVGMDL